MIKQQISPKIKKILLPAGMLITVILILFLAYKVFGRQFADLFRMLRRGDRDEIGEYLNRQGQLGGMIAVFFISILQVISIVIPGMAIHISAGLILGWWRAFLSSYLGFVFGNVLVFRTARRLGNTLQDLMPKENNRSWLTRKINSASAGFVIALACLVPGVPNGIIPYIAARTNLSLKKYSFAIAVTCWVQILCNCCAGHFLIRGEFLYMVLSFAVQILLIIIVARNKDYILLTFNEYKRKIRGYRAQRRAARRSL